LQKQFNIFRRSEDYGSPLRRRLCIDIDPRNSREIRDYLYANLDDFLMIAERILTFDRLHYDKFGREYTGGKHPVSALKFFDAENTRIYCQEVSNADGEFFIICAKLFTKRSQKNDKKNIPILKIISDYEYTHKP
jgi:hypothetical protein